MTLHLGFLKSVEPNFFFFNLSQPDFVIEGPGLPGQLPDGLNESCGQTQSSNIVKGRERHSARSRVTLSLPSPRDPLSRHGHRNVFMVLGCEAFHQREGDREEECRLLPNGIRASEGSLMETCIS